MKHRIVVIDDEAAIRDSLKMILEYDGYECLLAPSGQAGLACVERDDPDLVFLDVKMPGMDGIEVLRKIRALDELLPVVIISGHGTVSTAVEATRLGAFDFLEKPLSTDRVGVTIRNALSQRQLRTENRSWRRAAEARHEMVGNSRALEALTEEIRRAAPVRSAVLIQGESGVGKELVARAIHRNGPRSARAVRAGQLRSTAGRPDRVGAVRARARVVHPAPPRSRSGSSSRRIAAASSWTRSATCR